MCFQYLSFSTAWEGISPWEVMGTSHSTFHSIAAHIPGSFPMPTCSAWPDDMIIRRCYWLQGQVLHILHLKIISQQRPNEMTFAEWTRLKSTRIYWAGSMWPGPSVMAELVREEESTGTSPKEISIQFRQMTWTQLKQLGGFTGALVFRLC